MIINRKLITVISIALCSFGLQNADLRGATLSGGFEGSNVVYIEEVAMNDFTCKLLTPPMPVPASNRYNNPGDHYHNWFMLKIEDGSGQTIRATITNADWGGGGNGMLGRADGKAVFNETVDPYSISSEDSWQKLTTATYTSPNFTFTIVPSSDLVWVALHYPALPTHTRNWILSESTNPAVNVETVVSTTRGRPLYMLFITDSGYPLSNKNGVVIYGQEHMNEQTGGWTCQGIVEFLTSGDPVVSALLEHVVFIVIPDLNPDATAAGINCDPDDGKIPQWRYNPAATDRKMPGMITPMTNESKAIWNRLVMFVESGGSIDFCFNIHQGGMDNWWGVYDLADPQSNNFDSYLRSYMPVSGAPWVPNTRQGYSRGGWVSYTPAGVFSMRLLGRCWEEWRTTAMGYEISLGAKSDNFLTHVSGLKYFGEAIARAVYDYYGGFTGTLTIVLPDGGEIYPSGDSVNIQWTSTGSISQVRIDCSVDGGASWINLVSNTTNDGNETVFLPVADSNSCLISIRDASSFGVADESNSLFTVGVPPVGTITVTSPNGGDIWNENWIDTVTWTSTGSIDNVKIEISDDNGLNWIQLACAVANTGEYRINVPSKISAECLARVSGIENSSVWDTSDGIFSIQPESPWPTLTVISPNGGESWTPAASESVRWTTTGVVANVGIALSIDEGASWTTLIPSTPNDGAESVSVPMVISSKCIIWVFDARNDPWLSKPDADPLDVSDNLFNIGMVSIPGMNSSAAIFLIIALSLCVAGNQTGLRKNTI